MLAFQVILRVQRGLPTCTPRFTVAELKLSPAPHPFDHVCHSASSRMEGQESRLRGCLSVLAAISPVAAPAVLRGPGSAAAALEDAPAGATARDGGACTVTGVPIGQDVSTAAFLARQLRLLMENSSGQSGKGLVVPSESSKPVGRCWEMGWPCPA